MNSRHYALFLLILWSVSACDQKSSESTEEDPEKERPILIEGSIDSNSFYLTLEKDSTLIQSDSLVLAFYESRNFSLAWFTSTGYDNPAETVVDLISNAYYDGLDPSEYHLDFLDSNLTITLSNVQNEDKIDGATLTKLELYLTDAYFTFSSHMYYGRTEAEVADPRWHIQSFKPGVDLIGDLNAALAKGGISELIQQYRPQHSQYAFLSSAMYRYDSIREENDWTVSIGEGETIKPGMEDERLPDIRLRLYLSGYSADTTRIDQTFYDSLLIPSVQQFQMDNGLNSDGEIGNRTIAALNISPESICNSIRVNLERWRWMPREYSDHYIVVNIPDQMLHVYEDGEEILTLRTIVGRTARSTPVFMDTMEYVEFNPYWTIPPTIMDQDILPKVREDPTYLENKGIKVVTTGGSRVNDSIDWNSVSSKNFPYKLRKDPGPSNDLGRIKFMFPNKYYIYIHDTPSRSLFQNDLRCYSSGCVRVQDPMQFALHVLGDTTIWSRDSIQTTIDSRKNKRVMLDEHIPVIIQYFTSWVTDEGQFNIRQDVYGRDEGVLTALDLPRGYREEPIN